MFSTALLEQCCVYISLWSIGTIQGLQHDIEIVNLRNCDIVNVTVSVKINDTHTLNDLLMCKCNNMAALHAQCSVLCHVVLPSTSMLDYWLVCWQLWSWLQESESSAWCRYVSSHRAALAMCHFTLFCGADTNGKQGKGKVQRFIWLCSSVVSWGRDQEYL